MPPLISTLSPLMLSYYDSIYLSPHLDDVALACGGQIYAATSAGKSVLIVTLMAGNPPPAPLSDYALSLHRRWQLESNAVSRRRNEDINACQILGADYVHWHTPDCIYRPHPETGEAMYASEEAIFGAIHVAESNLVDGLSKFIDTLPNYRQLFAPLTVGHHVDHQITRRAAELNPRAAVFYYEDFPYVGKEGALEATIPLDTGDWHSRIVRLTDAQLDAKVISVAAYESQITTLFADLEDMERRVRGYARDIGGERIWSRLARAKLPD